MVVDVKRSVGFVLDPIPFFLSMFYAIFWCFQMRLMIRRHPSNRGPQDGLIRPLLVDTLLHDLSRDLFLWHRFAAVVDDGLGLRGYDFAGLGLVGGATVVGDAGVGAVLTCGAHGCGEVVVGGWKWWR